jgi:hypothetical protein
MATARNVLLAACLVVAPLSGGTAAVAEPLAAGDTALVERREVPARVMDAAECDGAGQDFVARQAFDGGVLFSVRCLGNNANRIQSLVRARDSSGRDASAVIFPSRRFGDGELAAEISNARIFPDARAIGEILVDPEHGPGAACRTESLFRFERSKPRLVFRRTSRSCDAAAAIRWHTVLDRRNPAERRLDWR